MDWIVNEDQAINKKHDFFVVSKTLICDEISVSIEQDILARCEKEFSENELMEHFQSARLAFIESDSK